MNDCQKYPELIQYFNLCEYSITDLVIVGVGTLLWVASYVSVIREGFKNKYIEMPFFVAIGNIAWEFVWSFMYKTNMGDVFYWGYRIWFFLDLFILYLILKYGAKQFQFSIFKNKIRLMTVGLLLFFGFFFYYFVEQGYDTPIGATSAFFLSVAISTLYIVLLVTNANPINFSMFAGVTRALGDGVLTVFVVNYTGNKLIAVMGVYVVLLDIMYVVLLKKMKQKKIVKTNLEQT